MTEPNWLVRDDLLLIHQALLARFGGLDGIRDESRLLAALERPRTVHFYRSQDHRETEATEATIVTLAAAYTVTNIQGHPFVDGNKRTGFMAAYTFLGINGLRLVADEAEATIMTLGLAASEIEEDAYARFLADNVEKR